MSTIYDFSARGIDGTEQALDQYRGRVLLVVNVASKCGFTPQYAGLETLYQAHRDAGLTVLGFPCDQFGHQEPGSEEEIRAFCSTKYDVSFPLHTKIEVNGANAHPLTAGSGRARRLRHRGHQVELHQIPGGPRWPGDPALRAHGHAGRDREGHPAGPGGAGGLRSPILDATCRGDVSRACRDRARWWQGPHTGTRTGPGRPRPCPA